MGRDQPWRRTAGGVVLRVRLTPRSSADEILDLAQTSEGRAVRAKVRAVPENGAANVALERLVADWLGVPRRSVSLDAGGKSRLKGIMVSGEPDAIVRLLEARLGAATG